MAKQPIFGKDPEKIFRLLSIGEDEEDVGEAQGNLGNSSTDSEIHANKDINRPDHGSSASRDNIIEKLHTNIEGYRIIQVLGEGGMGIVYLAEQQYPVRRLVALKIIKPGMDSKRVMARFEAEQQTLAWLDHPNIAQVFDAGTTETGCPFFVMEYVKGLPITEYCDHCKLTLEERLRLFQQVCLAVHHAHQKGIIHRDIKPSNILVANRDDQAFPKIIDFGVAKAVFRPLTEQTLSTEQGQLFGTPEYMSPEQADMAIGNIDTRSDIYSLGVLLYELLTGVLPFDSETLRGGGINNIRKVIHASDPKTPSTRLTSLGEEAEAIAQNRRMEIQTLAKYLRKELEWIPLKAMRKECSERYRSASEFADDIENYLKGAPLIAGPESGIYHVKKLVRKNRTLVTGIAAMLIVLVAGIIVSTFFAIKANYARDEAQALSEFLRFSVLESLDPFKVGGRQINIRSVLDTASKDLQDNFRGTPMAEAEIRHTIGFAYWSLGLYKQAELHYRRAVDICRKQLGNEDPKTLLWVKELGWGYFSQSRYNEAEQLFREALEGMQRELGEEDLNTLHAMASLGAVYYIQGRFAEAEQLCHKALETSRLLMGEGYARFYYNNLANGYHVQGRYKEAEELFTRAIDNSGQWDGEKEWYTLLAMLQFGELCWDLGHFKKAERYLLEVLDGWRDTWGLEHPQTLWTKTHLGWLYYSQGRYKEAEDLLYPTLETARQTLGEVHLLNMHAMHALGTLYLSQKRYDEAEPLLEKTLENGRDIMGEENWFTLNVASTLARLYAAQSRYEEAEGLYLKTLEAQHLMLSQEHPHTLASMNGLAVLHVKQRQYENAERLFIQALELRREKLGEDHPATFETKNDLAILYKEQGDYDKAEPLFIKAVEGRRHKLGDTHPHTIESLKNLIDLYEASNKSEKAEEWRVQLAHNEDSEK